MTVGSAIWPEHQRIEGTGEPNILLTHFKESPEFHKTLAQTILRLERDSSHVDRFAAGACGVKVHNVERWKSPEAQLVCERVRSLFCKVLKVNEAYVDTSWANIYRNGDYCVPHSHTRAQASIVYMVDEGDINTKDTIAGKLCIVDPRLKYCCYHEPGRLTRIMTPEMRPGSMLIFPGATVHCVSPYFGQRTRITMSWNVNTRAIPGNAEKEFEEAIVKRGSEKREKR